MPSRIKPHHPPIPGKFDPPADDRPGYIEGESGVAGFGCRDFYVAWIPSRLARELLIKHHYSHRIVNNSYCHLGVYYRRNLAGALSFGYALNPIQVGKIVPDTKTGEYMELNRMWLADVAPRNSESKALSYAFKYIKRACPSVAWVQSFADERCGRNGVVYQAANFLYCGHHWTEFYFLDAEYYHVMLLTTNKKGGGRGRTLRANLDRAIPLRFRQFRYVYFIKKNWRKRLALKTHPYPKPESTD
ncbi:hypothetical protein [Pseudodesulfovibrio indicus]|uniref:Uncharacterized protein n=1 Tax=Pseudodesulfovibrio indicus TaxID=1716143 RepID=A0AA94TJ81_9BACT|nr:hypothetical protein [Pseudodesulfovibrio indicus]TDT86384.1 hypothetical protein EDC59_11360 [Pseudodesulfovibrio indicus]